MAKCKAKVKKFGYALRVKMLNDKAELTWRHVGFIFKTRREALAYHASNYSFCDKYTVMGVRLNVVPVGPPGRGDVDKAVA